MFTIENPESVMDKLKVYFAGQDCNVKESEKKYKVKACFSSYDEKLVVNVRVEEADKNVYCVKVEKAMGSKMDFFEVFNEIKGYMNDKRMVL